MNNTQIQTEYLLACRDQRLDVRNNALEKLRDTKYPELIKLADISIVIFKILNGLETKSEKEILQMFDGFSMTQNWNSLIAITGTMFLNKANEMEDKKEQEGILKIGLKLLSRAQNSGIMLTDATIERVKKLRNGTGTETSKMAERIVSAQTINLFDFDMPKEPRKTIKEQTKSKRQKNR